MRDINKIAEKMDKLWSGGKFRTVKPVKTEETYKTIDADMTKFAKTKK